MFQFEEHWLTRMKWQINGCVKCILLMEKKEEELS